MKMATWPATAPKVKAPPVPEKKTVTFKEDKDKGKEGLSKASQGQEDEET